MANNKEFPQMKFIVGDKVSFIIDGKRLLGVIEIADFGGSLENDYHSYDIFVAANNCLYKHIPEINCRLAD